MIAVLTALAVLVSIFQVPFQCYASPKVADRLLCSPRLVQGLDRLDYDQFSGDWKEILKSPGPPNLAPLSSGVWRIDFKTNTFTYAAAVEGSSACIKPIVGRITEEYSTDNIMLEYQYFSHHIQEKLKVVATDYTSYAILYSCAWTVPNVGLCAPDATHVTVLARHGMDERMSVQILADLRAICVKRYMLVEQDGKVTCALDPPPTISEGGSQIPGTARCFKKKQPGFCQSQIQAFYYNSQSRKCEQFTFTGCGANENHFLAEEECVKTCQQPLEQAGRTESTTQKAQTCDGHCGLNCPSCCAMQDDKCITCHCERNELQAWLGTPSSCVDSPNECPANCQARQNSTGCFDCQCQMEDGSLRPAVEYRTIDPDFHCPAMCQPMPSPSGPKCSCVSHEACNLPFIGGHCDSNELRYFYNKSSARCDVINGCNSNQNNFDTEEHCLAACSDICHFPKDTGSCKGDAEKRYFYNSQSGHCESMMYAGCGGNDNNFLSLGGCKKHCENACEQEEDTGSCGGHLKRYYYDKEEDICRPFIYGGCVGNGNNFYTEEQCNRRCKGATEGRADDGVDRALCHLPLDEGMCDNDTRAQTRYFYDAEKQECRAFVFAGCGGNDNNFMQLYACNKTCYGSGINVGINVGSEINPRPSGKCPSINCSCLKRKTGKNRCPVCDCSSGSGAHCPSSLVLHVILVVISVSLLSR